jgi:hypothetical protein
MAVTTIIGAATSMTPSRTIKAQHFLDKIRNLRYMFGVVKSLFSLAGRRAERPEAIAV